MRKAETVTFGGSGLDRAAWLRSKAEDLSAHMTDGSACILPIWRGKPLFAGHSAAWVAPGHPVLETAAETPVFLGLDEGQARFAADISAWAAGWSAFLTSGRSMRRVRTGPSVSVWMC